MNQFAIITPVPDIIDTFVKNSILKKIIERKVIQLKIINLRDFGLGKHKQIDDAPFGGVGDSGTGSYHGYEGFINFSHSKTVFSQTPYEFPLKITRPPYGAGIRRFLDIMIRK